MATTWHDMRLHLSCLDDRHVGDRGCRARRQVPTGDPGAKPGGDQAAKHRRGARYWLKAAGFVLGVVVWALLVRIVLGSGPGDTGGHDGGPGPSTVTPEVSQRQDPGSGGGHVPPSDVPSHGG